MNKNDIIRSLVPVLGSHKEARDATERIFSGIRKALREGDRVVISGFGSFHNYLAQAKTGRNPRTGQVIHLTPKRKVRFRQAKNLLK